MIEKPQILTLNLTEKANNLLTEKNFNIYAGSLGSLVETNNKKHESKLCLLNHDFPLNIHEFDIVIIDLTNEIKVPYEKEKNIRKYNRTQSGAYILSQYPQSIFDPRGFTSFILKSQLEPILKRDSIIIVFQDENITITYDLVEENGNHMSSSGTRQFGLYEFMPIFPFSKNKQGKETIVSIKHYELNKFLEKYNENFVYETTYYHPTTWNKEEYVNKPNFFPLVKNRDDEIISFAYFEEKYGLYVFPILEDNSEFLVDFLQSVAPTIQPKVFPFSEEKKWTKNAEYFLPNHDKLIQEKNLIIEEYESKIQKKESEIEKNTEKYQFLHDILTESGEDLVKSVITFFEWIGFKNVKDFDSENGDLKEEDIQIDTEKGLLIIEVKGIGGTSKDSECSQISKIKFRRAEERGRFDVFGLYIVNHQRHLPPIDRKNPPFLKVQIEDALKDKRGLLTTWQLFNLYFDILNGILTKEEAKQNFFDYGLIKFKPTNLIEIDVVKETYHSGLVSIINITKTEIKKGDELYVEKNNRFKIAKVLEIKINDENVDFAKDGEIGIKTDIKIEKKSKIWKKNLP
jgi:hypothetical protein